MLQEDFVVTKRFAVREQVRFEIQAQMFNAFNRHRFVNFEPNFSSPKFRRDLRHEPATVYPVGAKMIPGGRPYAPRSRAVRGSVPHSTDFRPDFHSVRNVTS